MRFVSMLLLAASAASASGLTIHMKTNEKQTAVYVDGDRVRVESDADSGMIFDAGTKKMIQLNAAKKTYSEMTTDEMAAMAKRGRAQMDAALAKMPAAQRKQLEERLNKPEPEVETKWERTGKDQTIAGLACKGYKGVTVAGPTEGCFVPWGHGVDKDDLKPMIAFSDAMRSAMGSMRAGASHFANDFERAPGFPAEQVIFDESGAPKVQTRLESLSRGSVAASHFQVPEGYTRAQSPLERMNERQQGGR